MDFQSLDNPLVNESVLYLKDLAQQKIILMQDFTCISKVMMHAFRMQNLEPNIFYRCQNIDTAFSFIAKSRNITFSHRR
jgi:hypothetical protein